jgi:hypothetical protein
MDLFVVPSQISHVRFLMKVEGFPRIGIGATMLQSMSHGFAECDGKPLEIKGNRLQHACNMEHGNTALSD